MFGKNDRPDNVFQHALVTAIITFAGGVITSICATLGVSVVTSVALLLTLSASVVVFNICRAQRATNASIIDKLTSDLERAVSNLSEDQGRRIVGKRIIREDQLAIEELSRAERTSEGSFLSASRCLRQLRKGDEAFAYCGPKNWASPEVGRYFDENLEAVARGVHMERIFVIDQSHEQRRIMSRHAASGAVTLILSQSRLVQVNQAYHFPPDFGFAVLGDNVVVHQGTGLSNQVTVFTSARIASVFRQIFRELREVSEPHHPKPVGVKRLFSLVRSNA